MERGLAPVRRRRGYETLVERSASIPQRASEAPGTPWQADNGTEVDEAQRELSAPSPREELYQESPERRVVARPRFVRRYAESPFQQTDYVRVEQRPSPSEGDDEHSVRNVAPDARQRTEIGFVAGDGAAVPLDQGARESRKTCASMEKTERTESVNDVRGVGDCQRMSVRVDLEEALERRRHEVRPSSLKQQLGNQDGVGIVRSTPGERSPLPLEPGEYAPTEPPPLRVIHGRGTGLSHGRRVHRRLRSHAMGSKAPVRAGAAVRLAE